MFMSGLTVLLLAFSLSARRIVAATDGSIAAPFNITDNVLQLAVRGDSPTNRWKPPLAPSQNYLLSTHQNRYYLAYVIVGGQLTTLAVETSFQTTWIASSKFTCLDRNNVIQPQPTCKLRHLSETTASKSLEPLRQRLKRDHSGTQFIEGELVTEKLEFGGLNSQQSPYFSISHPVLLADKGYWEGDGTSHGVLGLAFPSHANSRSVLRTLFKSQSIRPIVSLALARYSPSIPNSGGLLTFGGIPDIPIDNRWALPKILPPSQISSAPRIEVEGFSISPPLEDGRRGPFIHSSQIMEVASGIPKLYLPARIVEYTASLFSPVAEYDAYRNLYSVRCNAEVPLFSVRVGRIPYLISKNDLLEPAPEYGHNMCILQIQPTEDGRLILGDPWLRNVLVVFDYTKATRKSSDSLGVMRVVGRKSW